MCKPMSALICFCSTGTSRPVRTWEAAEKFASCPIACPANTACNSISISFVENAGDICRCSTLPSTVRYHGTTLPVLELHVGLDTGMGLTGLVKEGHQD